MSVDIERRTYRRSPHSEEQLRAIILDAAAATPPESGTRLAKRLGMDVKSLRQRCPKEYGVLQVARRKHLEQEAQARYRNLEERFEAAARQLAHRGVAVTRRSLQAEAGLTVFKGVGNRPAALETVFLRRSSFNVGESTSAG